MNRSAGGERSARSAALALAVTLGSSGCLAEGLTMLTLEPGDVLATLDVGGVLREYWVHTPPGLVADHPVPLFVALHGAGGAASDMRDLTALDEVADRHGFVVVYPEGLENTWKPVGSIQDRDFLAQVVDHVSAQLPVDPERVFAIGFSQGALMTHRLGCTTTQFKAIVSVAASVSMFFTNCPHPDPGPALFIMGTADRIFPFEEEEGNALGHWGAVGGARFWAKRIGCDPEQLVHDTLPDVANDGLITERWVFGACPRGSVRLYGVMGGGHTWPGATVPWLAPLGPLTRDFDATETIVDYLLGL